MRRILIFVLLVLSGVFLVGMIISSSGGAEARGERDKLSETQLKLVSTALEDSAKFLGSLGNSPGGSGEDQLRELIWINNEALLLKHSGIYTMVDETPGLSKLGYKFSEAPGELQLVIYNIHAKVTNYHYQPSSQDMTRARNLSQAVYELSQTLQGLQSAVYNTDADSQQKLQIYKQKADQATKLSQEFLAELKKE